MASVGQALHFFMDYCNVIKIFLCVLKSVAKIVCEKDSILKTSRIIFIPKGVSTLEILYKLLLTTCVFQFSIYAQNTKMYIYVETSIDKKQVLFLANEQIQNVQQ